VFARVRARVRAQACVCSSGACFRLSSKRHQGTHVCVWQCAVCSGTPRGLRVPPHVFGHKTSEGHCRVHTRLSGVQGAGRQGERLSAAALCAAAAGAAACCVTSGNEGSRGLLCVHAVQR
jgi:hypothetical protein